MGKLDAVAGQNLHGFRTSDGYPYTLSDELPMPEFDLGVEICTDQGTSVTKDTWNGFEHYKLIAEPQSMGVMWRTGWFNIFFTDYNSSWYVKADVPISSRFAHISAFGGADRPLANLPPMWFPTADGGIPAPAELDSLMQNGLNSILPGLRSNLSLVNSVYELKDFKSLAHTAKNLSGTLGALRGLLKPSTTLKSFRELARIGSDVYLQKSFNIDPLLSDIKGFIKALKSFKADVGRRLSDSEKVLKHHFAVSLKEYDDSQDSTSEYIGIQNPKYSYFANSWPVHRSIRYEPSKFHLEVEYSYYYTDFQLQHAALLGLLDELGVNLNPNIIWNAIPWSFVVDWVAGVSRYLDQFKHTNMEPVINIRRALWSIKRRRTISCSVDVFGYQGLPSSVVTEAAYRRQPFLPTRSSVELSGLSSKEFSLGAALVLTR